MTWKEAFFSSPGPDSLRSACMLSLKGLCMGTADIIPGVSGGTIALITGIYQDLLRAIRSADLGVLRLILRGDLKGATARFHLRFLLALLLGIGTAIVSLARAMNYLLHHQPVLVWSLFLGLVAASIVTVAGKASRWNAAAAGAVATGTVLAWIIVSRVPVSTPETWGFIFFSGMVAICAMILPGISGAFILVILGKYSFITGALKNPFIPDHLLVIVFFCFGCLVGIVVFSRLLHHLLTTRYNLTIAFLTGLMVGSLPKLWPWQVAVESGLINGKIQVLATKNVLPTELGGILLSAALFVIGAAIVFLLERLSHNRSPHEAAQLFRNR